MLEYRFWAETLCLGERMKGGLYRPCETRVIRYSAATGTLRKYLGSDVHAAGYFRREFQPLVRYFVYAPRDRALGVSKIPVTVQYLANVEGYVYVLSDRDDLPAQLEFSMGALKSYGFGRCRIEMTGNADERRIQGRLMTRLPETIASRFGISVLHPRLGYLFEPRSVVGGVYVRSLLEDSLVEGPACLVAEVGDA